MALLLHGRKSGREDNIGGPQLPVKDGKANNKEEDRDRDEKRKEHGRPPEENMGERETGEVKEMGTQEAGRRTRKAGSEEPETIKDKEKTAAYSHQRTGATAKDVGRDGCNITINDTDTGHADRGDKRRREGGKEG